MKVLVTGAAGFIGYHVARRLAESKRCEVLGVDVIGDYYDPALKRARLDQLAANTTTDEFRFVQGDFADAEKFSALVAHFKPAYVVHLGAQPGVRYSIEKPAAYTHSNLDGFASVLEACRRTPPKHLVFASSSSVYGAGAKAPFREDDNTDQPVSFYGATKKANEVIAHSYAHVHGLNLTGLRFFTVYGPWGRPDMALFKFTKAMLEGKPIQVFNHGRHRRDFTYIDDIVEGVIRVLDRSAPPNLNWNGAKPDTGTSQAPWRVYNIGNNNPVELMYLIEIIEKELGRVAEKRMLPLQPGDVPATSANVDALVRDVGFAPQTPIETGVANFVAWYREYFQIGD